MIPVFLFWKNPLWWLPTDEDRANYQKERKDAWRLELPEINHRFIEASEKYSEALNKLEKTFSKEQYELYMEAKNWANKATFEKGRQEHHIDELSK
jgi:hypothetical protein